jgi:phosphoenolpyruvate carboxykinase (GTP)
MNKPANPTTVNLNVPAYVKNAKLIQWVEGVASLTQPSQNMRILARILSRTENKVGATETPLGLSPNHVAFNRNGLALRPEQFNQSTAVRADDWRVELDLHQKLFNQLANRLPKELLEIKTKIANRFRA